LGRGVVQRVAPVVGVVRARGKRGFSPGAAARHGSMTRVSTVFFGGVSLCFEISRLSLHFSEIGQSSDTDRTELCLFGHRSDRVVSVRTQIGQSCVCLMLPMTDTTRVVSVSCFLCIPFNRCRFDSKFHLHIHVLCAVVTLHVIINLCVHVYICIAREEFTHTCRNTVLTC